MAKTESRRINANATLDTLGGPQKISLSQIVLQSSVNSVSQGNLEFHMLGGGAVKIDLSKTIEVSAFLQNEYYNNAPNDPNITLNINDGRDGETVEFEGYFLAPGVQSSPGDFSLTGNIRSRAVELQNFIPSIWETDYNNTALSTSQGRGYTNPITMDAHKNIDIDTSLAERIYHVLKSLENRKITPEFYQNSRCGDPVSIFEQLYAQNDDYKGFAYEFLENSFNTTPFNAINEDVSKDITNYLYSMLMSNRMSFWDTIVRVICPQFFLQISDRFGGDLKLETYNPLSEPDGSSVVNITERFSSQLSESSRFPLKGVIAESDLLDDVFKIQQAQDETRNPNQARYFSQFPEPRGGPGRVDTVQLPEWLGRVILNTSNMLENDTVRGEDGPGTRSNATGLTFEQSIQSMEQLKRVIAKEQTDVCEILTSWARFNYFDRVLKNSTISSSVPLNLGFQVGKTYTIRTANGEEVAKGFLQNVSHSIQLTNERGNGTTNLSFTHVRSKGLEIPT